MPAATQVPNRPRLIAIGGLSGTGKSTLARLLCGSPADVGCLRSDVERKRLFGVPATTRLGPEGYTADVTAHVYRTLCEQAAGTLMIGKSVIVDAVFARPQERDDIAAVAHRAAAGFIGLWLEAPQSVQSQRVASRRGDASDATADVVGRQALYDLGLISWHRIDASRGPGDTLSAARAILAA